MKPSSESSENRKLPSASFELEPITDPPVRHLPPLVSIEEMMRRSRQLREWFPNGIRTPEERWQAKTDEVFRL